MFWFFHSISLLVILICGPFYGQHANFKSFNSWSFNGDTESEIVDETEIFFVLFKTLIMGFDSNRPRWKPEEEGNDTCKVLSLFCPKRQRIEYKRMEFLGSLLLLLPDDGKFKRQVDDDVVARPNNTQRPLCSERVGTCNGTFSFSFLNFFFVCVCGQRLGYRLQVKPAIHGPNRRRRRRRRY